ncbi:hypothetical protein FB45DRAFT_929384 [Roridomyces roridus]|uniref:Uncharacterized protein n=1 Tax=Roridomyces roridus TaxID=1738132 RepID=A0AAD7BFT8_9AGAR|nr:hypothetical protein FB45DRAFT_929384 [Roridomyces roridus]
MDASDIYSLLPCSTVADAKKLGRERRRAIQEISANWFTDPTLDDDSEGEWSTDWKDFDIIFFWKNRTHDGTIKIDKLLKETWVVLGTIEMLAFMPGGDGLYWLFSAGGEYYFWADYLLKKHSKRFASHQEFVDRVVRGDGAETGLRLPDVVVPQAVETDFKWWFE